MMLILSVHSMLLLLEDVSLLRYCLRFIFKKGHSRLTVTFWFAFSFSPHIKSCLYSILAIWNCGSTFLVMSDIGWSFSDFHF